MRVSEALIANFDNHELPILIIDEQGVQKYYESVDKFLSSKFNILKDYRYIGASVQLDLNGEDSFIVLYCDSESWL